MIRALLLSMALMGCVSPSYYACRKNGEEAGLYGCGYWKPKGEER